MTTTRGPRLHSVPSGGWIPPNEFSEVLEREVLEAVFHDPTVLPTLSAIVAPIDFQSPRLRTIYAAMTRVESISVVHLAEDLGRHGELEKVGGLTALFEIEHGACTAANAVAHARMVQRYALERRERVLHERIARGEDLRRELAEVESALAVLEVEHLTSDSILLSGDRLRELREAAVTMSPLPGLLDCEPSLHLLQGRPKSGKTRFALALGIAWSEALSPWTGAPALPGTRVLVVSAEQSARRVDRVLRGLSLFVQGSKLDRWTDRLAIVARAKSLPAAARPIFTLDSRGLQLLRSVLAGAREAGDPFGLVVLDSLSRLKPPDADENSADDMTRVCAALQEIAESENVYVLLIHHRGHNADSSRAAAIGASRGSSAIAAVAQVAWTLDIVPSDPRQRVLRVAGNEVPEGEITFQVAAEKADPGAVNYFKRIDPLAELADRIDDLIAVGESISTSELAWRIAGERPEDGAARPPGRAAETAAKLREHWKRAGRVTVEDLGTGIGYRISRPRPEPTQ